jgi:hypothetical protein
VTIPAVILNRGTVITVTNATMAINGDTSSVAALMANPGPDGISLQEAVIATNNDPGTWNIQFAPALKGSIIDVDSGPQPGPMGLSFLAGGNVTINGDIDGDGEPDVTITSTSANLTIFVISGGNTVNGLALENCAINGCVSLRNPSASGGLGQGPPVTGKTLANTTLSNLVLTNIAGQGAAISICPNCGPTLTSPTGNTWDHVLITGNTITGNASGPNLGIDVQIAWGDTLQHTTIAYNNISLTSQESLGIAFNAGGGLGQGAEGTQTLLDTRMIDNTITTATYGIELRGGGVGSPDRLGSLYDGAQVIGNRITLTGEGGSEGGNGILFFADDEETGVGSDVARPGNHNVMRNIAILANAIQAVAVGIMIPAGGNGAADDATSNVSIQGNTILEPSTSPNSPTPGIALQGAGSDGSAVVGTGNSLNNILIQWNTLGSLVTPGNVNFGGGNPIYAIQSAGISVYGGTSAQENSINGLEIANNEVNTPQVGIAITAGYGDGKAPADGGPIFSADNNVIAGAQIFCNQVDQIPTNGIQPSSGIKGINVVSGYGDASGNQVQQVFIGENLLAGTLGDASTFAYLGSGGSGNILTTSSIGTPAISTVAIGGGERPQIGPETAIEIEGVNLAPGTPDVPARTRQTVIDGVSVTVNGVNASVSYISPTRVGVFTPGALSGTISVVVTNNGISSAPFVAEVQPSTLPERRSPSR